MVHVKVLGPGCRNCEKVEAVVKEAIAAMGIDVRVEKITDYADIMRYNVLATPGLVIDEQLVAAGRIPQAAEVTTWLANALEAA